MRSWKNKVLVAGLALSLNPLVALGQSTPQSPPPTNPQASTQTNPRALHRRHRRHHRKHRRHHRRPPVAVMSSSAAFPV